MPNKTRILISAIIIIIYAVFVGIYYPTISETYTTSMEPPKSRTFSLPLNFFLFNYSGFGNPDISIVMNLTYPNGTLVIGEPVYIKAKAVFHNNAISEVTAMKIGFQNSLLYPESYNAYGELLQGSLLFKNKMATNQDVTYVDSALELQSGGVVFWSIDGDYAPIVQFFFSDNSSSLFVYDEIVIHVYPMEQLTQIETNRVSLILSVIVLGFSTVGIAALVVQILDHTENKCNYTEDSGDDKFKCPYLEAKRRHEFFAKKKKEKTDDVKTKPNQ